MCSRNLVLEIVGESHLSPPFPTLFRQIVFKLANVRPKTIYRKNPKRMDRDLFRRDLSTDLCDSPKRHGTSAERCVDYLHRALCEQFREELSSESGLL